MTALARHEEWEPSAALRSALEGLPMGPETGNGEHLAGLKPYLEGALRTLRRLERQRGLSAKERTREGAFRVLLAVIERVE